MQSRLAFNRLIYLFFVWYVGIIKLDFLFFILVKSEALTVNVFFFPQLQALTSFFIFFNAKLLKWVFLCV